MKIGILFLIVIVIFGISFSMLNSTPVTMNYYIGQKTFPLSILLVSDFSLGILLGLTIGLWFYVKLKVRIYRLKQRLVLAETEISNLRAIPLQN